MELSDLKISILVESYDVKADEHYRNSYVAGNRIVSKLSKSRPTFRQIHFGPTCFRPILI